MSADIIKGPWKKNNTNNVIDEIEKAKILAMCDKITSDCTVATLQHLVENDMAPEDPDDDNIRYVVFLTDLLLAITYTRFGLEHPFQDMVNLLSGVEIHIDNSKNFYIDYDTVEDVVKFLKTNKGKEPA
jgi:hypothetical protein|tara:strand:- start:1486 stop:1872 length:387 start_codon:yes stop_codon:yes gene_type:complete